MLWLFIAVAVIVIAAVIAYRVTTPGFVYDLSLTAVGRVLQEMFKVSQHTQEYWDIQHQLMLGNLSKDERFRLEWDLQQVLKKEAEG